MRADETTVDPFAGMASKTFDVDEATPDLLLLDEDEDVNIEAM